MKTNSISDERAIANLMVSYAYANDNGDIKKLGDLFANATIKIGEITATGRDEIVALAKNLIEIREDGRSSTTHEMTNIIIEVSEDGLSAQASAYWTLYKTISGSPREAVLSGRYSDHFLKNESTWFFKSRYASLLWKLDVTMFQ